MFEMLLAYALPLSIAFACILVICLDGYSKPPALTPPEREAE